MSAPWSPRAGHTCVVEDGKIWLIGGDDITGSLNDVWYSSDGSNWTQVVPSAPWLPRRGHTSIVFNQTIWVMGGYASTFPYRKNDVWYASDLAAATAWKLYP
jgi:N-acetylneuraminic acid mutarotase